MQFNKETFCPYITDKSTPIRKYLYCSKINDLCKMVTYSPNGQMIPMQDVKSLGCPYGYAIQGIEKKEKVTVKNDVLDDISVVKVQKSNPKTQVRKQNVTSATSKKKRTKKKS